MRDASQGMRTKTEPAVSRKVMGNPVVVSVFSPPWRDVAGMQYTVKPQAPSPIASWYFDGGMNDPPLASNNPPHGFPPENV